MSSSHACAVRRVMLLLLPLLMVVAAMPLTGTYRGEAYQATILGTPYVYQHALVHQQYEIRDLPMLAIALFAVAALVALWERHPFLSSRLLAAAGVGAMAFSFFRWGLLSAFADNQLWFVAWEELSELLFVTMAWGLVIALPSLARVWRDACAEPAHEKSTSVSA